MRTSRNPATTPRKKRKWANAVIIVVILGIAAYFLSAGAAGSWIAQNIIEPVMGAGGADAAQQPPDSSPAPSASPSSTPAGAVPAATGNEEQAGSRAEEKVSAQRLALYTLQSGAYSDEANARSAAAGIAAKGGAGYVKYDGELYRVLISGYLKQSDAGSVKQTLSGENVQTSVYEMKSGSLEFKIAAQQPQIDAVKTCLAAVPESVAALEQVIFSVDSGKNADAQLTAIKTRVGSAAQALQESCAENEGAISELREYVAAFNDTIQALPDSSGVSKVEYSSQLKYNLISIVDGYADFLDEIGS